MRAREKELGGKCYTGNQEKKVEGMRNISQGSSQVTTEKNMLDLAAWNSPM